MLNKEQIKNIKLAEKVIFTTSDKNNQPRSIWVIPSRVESNQIIISNIQMSKTFNNLQSNNKAFINVLIPEQDDLQYKIECVTEINTSGNLFNEIKNFEESENLPPELKVNAIIICKIKNCEESRG